MQATTPPVAEKGLFALCRALTIANEFVYLE
jgi:hypothetical protein